MTKIKIANFTMHDQTPYLAKWQELGFDMNPRPRAPVLLESANISDSERIKGAVEATLDVITLEEFQAVLIGGLTDAMIYAAFRAWENGLRVFVAVSPKGRDPLTQKLIFKFEGVREVIPPRKMPVR
jgi:hypothetical protein